METALFAGGAGCSMRLETCVDAERTEDSTEDDHKSNSRTSRVRFKKKKKIKN